jgi:uncharacterized protein
MFMIKWVENYVFIFGGGKMESIKNTNFAERLSKQQIIIGLLLAFTQCTKLWGLIPEIWIIISEIMFVAIIFSKTLIESIKGAKEKIMKTLLWTIIGFIVIFILQNIVWDAMIKQIFMQMFMIEKIENSNQSNLATMLVEYPILMSLLVVVIGPILEEIIYRFALFRTLYDKNHFLGYFITAFVFGLQHIFSATIMNGQMGESINIIGYMIFGFGLSFIYAKTKNLTSSILIHILNNLIGVIIVING